MSSLEMHRDAAYVLPIFIRYLYCSKPSSYFGTLEVYAFKSLGTVPLLEYICLYLYSVWWGALPPHTPHRSCAPGPRIILSWGL